MQKNSRLPIKWSISLLHAIVLIVITIFLQYLGNIRIDEIAFFKFFAIAKHNVLGIDRKPVKDSVVFLDVSKDQKMIDDTGMNYGHVHITDRAMLAHFFAILNQHKGEYKAVICDIAFDLPSADDSLLKAEIEHSVRVFIPSTLSHGKRVSLLFKCPSGGTGYLVNNGDFIKYPLFYNDSVKSLPVVMAEKAGKNYEHKNRLTYENNHLTFNTVIPELYYRTRDMDTGSLQTATKGKRSNLFYLGEMLPSADFFQTSLKNKYILIGDFYNDRHSTYLGAMPGTLILFDTFLTLRDNRIAISWGWIVLLLVVFFPVSYYLFYPGKKDPGKVTEQIKISFLREFVVKYFSYLGILILLNVFSYVLFGVFVSLFYLATYLTFVHTIVEKAGVYKKTKRWKDVFNT